MKWIKVKSSFKDFPHLSEALKSFDLDIEGWHPDLSFDEAPHDPLHDFELQIEKDEDKYIAYMRGEAVGTYNSLSMAKTKLKDAAVGRCQSMIDIINTLDEEH